MNRANGTSVAARAAAATKVYGEGLTEVRALDGITVEFDKQKFSAIMGPSGSGKSTLLHCLAGLDVLSSGKIFIGDVDLGELSERQLTRLRRDKVGFVFQAYNLVPTLTAIENINLPSSIARRKPDQDWLTKVLDAIHLGDRLDHRPSELSGGEQQRTAAARALAGQPEIIFADEPSGNLDSKTGGELLDFLKSAVDDFGQTIVMVTHDAAAASRADRVVFLGDGQIVGELHSPTADTILDHIKSLEA